MPQNIAPASRRNKRHVDPKSQHSGAVREAALNDGRSQIKVSFGQLPDEGYIRQSMLLEQVLPVSSATLWRMIAAERFVAPIKLAPNVTAWRVGDVRAWLDKQAAKEVVA